MICYYWIYYYSKMGQLYSYFVFGSSNQVTDPLTDPSPVPDLDDEEEEYRIFPLSTKQIEVLDKIANSLSNPEPDPFGYCSCKCCHQVSLNAKSNTWFHSGKIRGKIGDIVSDYFESRPGKFGVGSKPYEGNDIWFSNGSWLFDCYCEGSHDDTYNYGFDYPKVKITNPINILQVNKRKELIEFVRKYGRNRGPDEYWVVIDWDKIYADGYYGLSFGFRKLRHLGIDGFNSLFSWHLGFDVESLIIFDTRAFDNTVEIARFTLI